MYQLVNTKDDSERDSDDAKRNPKQKYKDHQNVTKSIWHSVFSLIQKQRSQKPGYIGNHQNGQADKNAAESAAFSPV